MDLVGRPPGPQSHQRMDAARVVADHPAESVMRVRRRVGGECEAVLLGLAAEHVEHRAGLDAGKLSRRVDRQSTWFRCLDQSITTATLQQPPVKAGAAAARQERRTMSPADRDRLDHIVDVPGNHDADRHLAIVRAVGCVKGAAAGVESHLAADHLAQLGRDRAGVDEERPVTSLRWR